MMKERPIIFSNEMVQAILDGRKTQTRRVIKTTKKTEWLLTYNWTDEYIKNPDNYLVDDCPYGAIGDRLWVREKWRIVGFGEDPFVIEYADGVVLEEPGASHIFDYDNDQYVKLTEQSCADCQNAGIMPDNDGYYYFENGIVPTRWRSPIHMPRWASRITLEITDIRVERLQEISERDCCLEVGAELEYPGPGPEPYKRQMKEVFAYTWDSLNEKRGYPWSNNPLVWVIEFKQLP
jgi:hypothetical protein